MQYVHLKLTQIIRIIIISEIATKNVLIVIAFVVLKSGQPQ